MIRLVYMHETRFAFIGPASVPTLTLATSWLHMVKVRPRMVAIWSGYGHDTVTLQTQHLPPLDLLQFGL